jgi:hypothetical protein
MSFVMPNSFAHLEQNSSGGTMEGKYFSLIGFDPRNPIQNTPTKIIFSIQDQKGNHFNDIQTMVEVYSSNPTNRIFLEPWTKQKISDFKVPYTFEKPGTYQIVLSISDETEIKDHFVPPRKILGSSQSCDCTRIVFNALVSEDLTHIWNSLMVIVVVLPFSVFGFAMFLNYKNKRKTKQEVSGFETVRYVIIFLAFAGGVVHLAIYVNHVPLRIEYGIFLLLAALTQIGFGVLYLVVLMSDSLKPKKEQVFYKNRHIAIQLFGLIGSAVLLGLYTYVVNFPPPLSPENHPEELELAGIVAKSLEISLIGLILYLLKKGPGSLNNFKP